MKMCYEMMGHIFGSVDKHDHILRNHSRRMMKLEKKSAKVGKLFALSVIVYILQEMHLRDLEKRTHTAEQKIKQIEAVLDMGTE